MFQIATSVLWDKCQAPCDRVNLIGPNLCDVGAFRAANDSPVILCDAELPLLCNRTSLFADFPRSPLSVAGSVIMNWRGVCAVVSNVFGVASDPLRDRSFLRTLLIILPARRYRRSRSVRFRRSGYKTRPSAPPPAADRTTRRFSCGSVTPQTCCGAILLWLHLDGDGGGVVLAIVPKQMSLHCLFAVAWVLWVGYHLQPDIRLTVGQIPTATGMCIKGRVVAVYFSWAPRSASRGAVVNPASTERVQLFYKFLEIVINIKEPFLAKELIKHARQEATSESYLSRNFS